MKKASCTALIFVLAVTAVALQVHSAFADDDPPGRIARMNFTEGSVSFQPGGEGDWLTAVPNRPLTTGDNLWTDRDSRDELHVGSTIMRMGPETSLTLLAARPDSLIARKSGWETAKRISEQATAVLEAGGVRSAAGWAALTAFDADLRDPQNSRNPGTTADLTGAAIFVVLWEDG